MQRWWILLAAASLCRPRTSNNWRRRLKERSTRYGTAKRYRTTAPTTVGWMPLGKLAISFASGWIRRAARFGLESPRPFLSAFSAHLRPLGRQRPCGLFGSLFAALSLELL